LPSADGVRLIAQPLNQLKIPAHLLCNNKYGQLEKRVSEIVRRIDSCDGDSDNAIAVREVMDILDWMSLIQFKQREHYIRHHHDTDVASMEMLVPTRSCLGREGILMIGRAREYTQGLSIPSMIPCDIIYPYISYIKINSIGLFRVSIPDPVDFLDSVLTLADNFGVPLQPYRHLLRLAVSWPDFAIVNQHHRPSDHGRFPVDSSITHWALSESPRPVKCIESDLPIPALFSNDGSMARDFVQLGEVFRVLLFRYHRPKDLRFAAEKCPENNNLFDQLGIDAQEHLLKMAKEPLDEASRKMSWAVQGQYPNGRLIPSNKTNRWHPGGTRKI